MKQEISPWSLYDSKFNKQDKREAALPKLLYNNKSNLEKASIDQVKQVNVLDYTKIVEQAKLSRQLKNDITIQKQALIRAVNSNIILKMLREQIKLDKNMQIQNLYMRNFLKLQDKNDKHNHLIFPRIINSKSSLSEYQSVSKVQRIKGLHGPFDDELLVQKSIQIFNKKRIKKKKLSEMLLGR